MVSYKRKKKKKINSFKKIVLTTVDECITEVADMITKNYRIMFGLVEWVLFSLLYAVFSSIGAEWEHVSFLFLLIIALFGFLKRLNMNVINETEGGIPVPKKRITTVDANGYINISDIDEAAGYLCEVEDYLQKKGVLKNDVSV